MPECSECGNRTAVGLCAECARSIASPVDQELGHLAYILADLERVRERKIIPGHVYRLLRQRYERRRDELRPPAPVASPPVAIARASAAAATPDMTPLSPLAPAELPDRPPTSRPAIALPTLDAPVLLLWLGAFMVTVASLIFVGYNWTAFGGPLKTLIMAAFTTAFLGGGRLCLARPTLRPAGQTFLLIGAALLPLTFVAAYNFWLSDEGLGWATLGLLAALVSTVLYGHLALLFRDRLYPPATVLALLATACFALEAVAVPRVWWPAAGALAGLGLWLAAERWLGGAFVIFRPAARWGSGGLALAVTLGMVMTSQRQPNWWAVAVALSGLALHAGLAATLRRSSEWARLTFLPATLGVLAVVRAMGGGLPADAVVFVGVAAVALLAAERASLVWRRTLPPYSGLLAVVTPWLAFGDRAPFVVATLAGAALTLALAWRWRQTPWLYGGAALVTASYTAALGWLSGEPSALNLARAMLPLVALAFAALVLAAHRLGRAWALPAYLWLVLASGLPGLALALDLAPRQDEAVLALALGLPVLAALFWVAVGLVGVAGLVAVPVALLLAATSVVLYRAGADAAWLPLPWLALGWAVWAAAPRRGFIAGWTDLLCRWQQAVAGVVVVGSLLLSLGLAVFEVDDRWWQALTAVLALHAALTIVVGETTAPRWRLRWAGPPVLLLAVLVALRAFGVTPLVGTYWLGLLAVALYGAARLAAGRGERGRAIAAVQEPASLVVLGLAVAGNVAIAIDGGIERLEIVQAGFYLLLALAVATAAVIRRQPYALYAAVALLAGAIVFGGETPVAPPITIPLAFSGAGWAVVGLAAAARRWPTFDRRLIESGLGLAVLAVVVATSAPPAVALATRVPSLLLLAGLLGLVAVIQRRRQFAEGGSAVALVAVLVQFGQAGLEANLWHSFPIAAWLLGLAVVRARAAEPAVASALTWTGVIVLLGPVIGESFIRVDGWRYSLLGGALALVLLVAGLRWRLRAPVAAATFGLTVLAARQVFDGLRALPSWAIIGVLGLAFLAVALVLLPRREDITRARLGLQAQWHGWR